MQTDLYVGKDYKTLYFQLMSGFYDALVLTDPNGHVLDVNPRAVEYFQYDPTDLCDQPISTLIPGVTMAVLKRIKTALDEARHILLNAQCLRKDKTEFAGEVSISQIDLDTQGDIIFTIRNIDRRKRQWQMLRSKSAAFEASLAACFCCDASGSFKAVNKAFLEMFNIPSSEEILGESFESIISDEPLPALFQQVLADGKPCTHRLAAESDDGELLLEFKLEPDIQSKNQIVGVIGSIAQV